MKHYILLFGFVFLPILMVAQDNHFTLKEEIKTLKEEIKIVDLFTKTFENKQVELEKIEKQMENYVDTIGMIVGTDLAENPFVDSIRIDSSKIDDMVFVVLKYNSDNQLYSINFDDGEADEISSMHFCNAIYYGGGIESVVKSSLFTFSFTDQDTIYDVVYEIVNQNGSPIISNRYIQKTPKP